MMEPVRLLVADDHEIVRRGLRSLLEAQPGWQVTAEASDGREAVEMAKQLAISLSSMSPLPVCTSMMWRCCCKYFNGSSMRGTRSL